MPCHEKESPYLENQLGFVFFVAGIGNILHLLFGTFWLNKLTEHVGLCSNFISEI